MPQVVETAMCHCSFGVAPSIVNVTSQFETFATLTSATIMDFIELVDIPTFGLCMSELNPEVIAATAAALGVLVPMPCVPVIVSPWLPGADDIIIEAFPALNEESMTMCAWGGVIEIVEPGEFTVETP